MDTNTLILVIFLIIAALVVFVVLRNQRAKIKGKVGLAELEIDTERQTANARTNRRPEANAEAKDASELKAQQKMDAPPPNAQQTAKTSGTAKADVKQKM